MESNITEDTPLYSISSAARILGISIHTLRMYEREGLIIPHKKESSHRLYSKSDIDRLTCIRTAIAEKGFSIAAIKTVYSLIPCWEIAGCSIEDRHACDFYNGHSEPCWNYKHENNPCSKRECRTCEVYKYYSECDNIKKAIQRISEPAAV